MITNILQKQREYFVKLNQLACFLVLICLVSFTSSSFSQNLEIHGTIRDGMNNTPLDYANVYVENTEGTVIAFTSTDRNGFYNLSDFKNVSDSLRITATLLGYQKKEFLLHLANRKKIEQNFFLSPTTFEIEEVVVRGESIPVLERNDTTTYRVANYIDSTEYSVEDVLKKLPGVRVSEEGSITVNGKPIDKVLIEGDDMFGANFTIGTKNIRANIIEKVQVIDHHQDNPVLKDVQASNRMVLNLGIKEEKKNIVSGTYTLGTGYGEELKKYVHANLFSLSKKAKTFILGNYNDNGFDAIGELNATYTDFNTANQPLENRTEQPNSLIDLPSIQSLGLPEKFSNRRKAGLGSISQIVNVTPAFKIKILGTHYREDNSQSYTNINSFFSSLDTLNFREETDYTGRNRYTDMAIQTDFLSSQHNKSIKTYSNISTRTNLVNQNLTRKENNVLEFIPQLIRERPRHIFNALEYTQKTNKYTATQLIFSHAYNENGQDFNSRYTDYAIFFGVENLDSLSQNSNLRQNKSQVILRYLYNKNVSLNLDVGYNWSADEISSDTRLYDDGTENEGIQLSTNNINLKQTNPMLKAVFSKQVLGMDLSVGLHTSLANIQLPTNTSRYWLLNPFFQVQVPIQEAATFKLLYKYNNELPNVNTLNNRFVFKDYQTVGTGVLDFTPIKDHRITGRFSYKNVLNSFYFDVHGYFSVGENFLGHSFNFEETIFQQAFYRPVLFKMSRGGMSLEKLFFGINSRFLVRYNYGDYTTHNRINEIEQQNRLLTNEVHLDYGSAFNIPLNFYLTNTVTFTKSLLSSVEKQNKLMRWSSKFRLLYKPTKKIHVDVSWYSIYNKTASGFTNHLDGIEANASFVFEYKKRRNELSISMVNLQNENQFFINSIGPYTQSQYGLEAVPRFFLLKWDTSF